MRLQGLQAAGTSGVEPPVGAGEICRSAVLNLIHKSGRLPQEVAGFPLLNVFSNIQTTT